MPIILQCRVIDALSVIINLGDTIDGRRRRQNIQNPLGKKNLIRRVKPVECKGLALPLPLEQHCVPDIAALPGPFGRL